MTCPILVERSENDYDAHGRFTRQWRESCGAPIHAHGMCLHHFNREVSKTRVEIDCCRERIARAVERLSLLLDSGVCAGAGAERISMSAVPAPDAQGFIKGSEVQVGYVSPEFKAKLAAVGGRVDIGDGWTKTPDGAKVYDETGHSFGCECRERVAGPDGTGRCWWR